MRIEFRKLSDIKPYESNPRINDAAVDTVAESIRQFGFRQPIVVDTNGVIIAGHTRYKAALKLNLEKVPVHVAKDLAPEQIKAYRIADNKTAELSDWDYDLLPIELTELQNMNYDLGLLGFDQDELAKLLDPGVKDGLCDPDDVPAPPDEATTRLGDLWLLGDRRLLCGDAGTSEDVDRSVKKINPQNMVHLTEKPVELAVRAMQYSSRPGENVLDLFGGSGSTLIGAEQTGRKAFLMELDPTSSSSASRSSQRGTAATEKEESDCSLE